MSTSVKVAIRIRPQLAREILEASRVCTYVTKGEPQITIGSDKSFTFDYMFDVSTQQTTVYETCIANLIDGCFDGYNATVLAYGQTGSGKTHTMGTGFDITTRPEDVGIIPRAMQHLFKGIHKRISDAKEASLPEPSFDVSAQFLELYNEKIIDLFDASSPEHRQQSDIKIHEDTNGGILLIGLTSVQVNSREETLTCLQRGALNRTTAATKMNSESSRSHAIFTITLKQTRPCILPSSGEGATSTKSGDVEYESLTAKFHFVDLAGSEKLKKTGATGNRAKEGISINSGLLALGNVISALGDAKQHASHVPYRNAKLTRLLQDSLGGNSQTLMIACVSPSDSEFMETLNTLRYANRARNIKNKVVANQDKSSKQIQILRQQLSAVQLELTEYKTGKRVVGEDGVEAYNDMFQENNLLQKENSNLKDRIKAMQGTIDSQCEKITSFKSRQVLEELGESGDMEALVANYIKEIEVLSTKLLESESMCSNLRRKQSDGMYSRSPTPNILNKSIDLDLVSIMPNGKSVLDVAKEEINQLSSKAERIKTEKSSNKENGECSKILPTTATANNVDDHSEISPDEHTQMASDYDDTASEVSSMTSDDENEKASIPEEVAAITYEIDVKQKLIDEVELIHKRMTGMQKQYENKLTLMADKIKVTEAERDKFLSNLDTKSVNQSDKVAKVRAEYQKKIEGMKKEMTKLQKAKKSHDQMIREKSKQTSQLKTLRHELDQMKSAKVRLIRQMNDDRKKAKEAESKRLRETMKLKKQFKDISNEARNLQTKNRQKDRIMKRKEEEMASLRKQLKPISGKFGRRRQEQALYGGPLNNNIDSKISYKNSKIISKNFRSKWNVLQKKMDQALTYKETILGIEKQMERLFKDREKLQRNLDSFKKRKKKGFSQDEEPIKENLKYVNDQINECQMEIVQVQETMDDSTMSNIVQNCKLNEAHYLLEHLLDFTMDKTATVIRTETKLKDLEIQFQASEESSKQAHEIVKYMLQEKSSIDTSITEYLNEYIKGADSDTNSVSSRDSSPERVEQTTLVAPSVEFIGDGLGVSPITKENKKARRRTATTQELLHGLPSPIQDHYRESICDNHDLTLTLDNCTSLLDQTHTVIKKHEVNMASSPLLHSINELTEENAQSPVRPTLDHEATFTVDRQENGEENIEDVPEDGNVITPEGVPPPPHTPPKNPISDDVFSRLTNYVMASPKDNKGSIQPITSKLNLSKNAPLVCTDIAKGHNKAVLSVQANDHLLFSGSKDRCVKVWNLVSGQEIMTLEGHPNNVHIVRHCENTGLVYSVSLSYIKVWDIRSKPACVQVVSASGMHHFRKTFKNSMSRTNVMPENESIINDIQLSPDSKYMYCASNCYTSVWDLNTFRQIGRLCGHSGNIMSISVTEGENPSVITGSKDRFIKIYNNPKEFHGNISPSTHLEPPHLDGVEALVNIDNILFSGSRDKSIKKWDLNSKNLVKSEYTAHSNWVCALNLIKSGDGDEILISGGREGILKLWDFESFGSIGSIRAHNKTINSIASNKTHVFTASDDKIVKIWKPSKSE